MVTKNKVKGKDIPPSYYKKLAMVESSNNPLAKADSSTAAGLYQFTEGTWKEMVEQSGLNYSLQDRFDPDKSLEVVKRFTQRNKKYLEKNLGRDVTENELYLSHFLGMGGSRKMLESYQEFPELTADIVLGEGTINSNPSVFLNKDGSVKTLREVYKWSADKFGVEGVEVPKDDAIWSVDENGNYISLNPDFATEAERQASNYMKQQYINTLYPEIDVNNNTNTATNTEQALQPKNKSVKAEEKPQWKQELDKKQEERDTVFDFIAKGALNIQTVDYNRQPLPNSTKQQFQDGGTFPISKNGLYDHPNQPVVVPTKDGNITMKGIDYPVFGIANTGEEILMQPNKEYHFKGATEVLEIPQFQDGGTKEDPPTEEEKQPVVLPQLPQKQESKVNPFEQYVIDKLEPANRDAQKEVVDTVQDRLQPTQQKDLAIKENEKSNTTLKTGSEGKSVEEYQQILKNLGYYTDKVDGKFGKNTKKAVEKFQEDKGLKKDGIIGNDTLFEIFEIDDVYTDPELNLLRQNIEQKEEGLNPDKKETKDLIEIGNLKTNTQVREIQEKLKKEGYDINPQGTFKNEGIDGILGKFTRDAIDKYNTNKNRDTYQSIKDNEGLLGGCEEEQCSEYVQNELFRNINPEVSRKEWNESTGLYGDAWTIGKNILNKGGEEVDLNSAKAGDVVTIYTGGRSEYQSKADKAGTGTTHTAVIDKVNPDGSFYILHNVHEGSSEKGFKGREYRNKVEPNGDVTGFWSFKVKNAYRPNTDKFKKDKKPLRNNVKLIATDRKKKSVIDRFIEPLNDNKNKTKLAKIHDLDEEEYNSLSKIALGILGQESDFGSNPLLEIKENVAKASSLVNKLTDGNFSDVSFIKGDEVSKGAGQLKYKTNFGNADLTAFGITEDNFSEDSNMPITVVNKLASDYKKFLDKGYDEKDAMYRAVVIYNASLQGESGGKTREDWAKDYDVDYANKVLNYANLIDVKEDDKNYKTIVDELLQKENVLKWHKKMRERGDL